MIIYTLWYTYIYNTSSQPTPYSLNHPPPHPFPLFPPNPLPSPTKPSLPQQPRILLRTTPQTLSLTARQNLTEEFPIGSRDFWRCGREESVEAGDGNGAEEVEEGGVAFELPGDIYVEVSGFGDVGFVEFDCCGGERVLAFFFGVM